MKHLIAARRISPAGEQRLGLFSLVIWKILIQVLCKMIVADMVCFFSGEPDALTNYPQPLRVLEAMVTAVHNHVQSG